jgi:ferredoxin
VSTVRITVDRELCIGAGQCVLAAPELFDQDDEGTVLLLHPVPGPGQDGAAMAAEHACPARVISVA